MGKFEEMYESLIKEASQSDVSKMLAQYLKTMLWSTTHNPDDDNNGKPLDDDYSVDDISKDTKQKSEKDCKKFLEMFEKELDKYNKKNKFEKGSDDFQALFDFDLGQLGHDFWLTRNGHGTGFWDGDYDKDIEDILMKITKKFKGVDPYVSDDNEIEIEI